MPSRYLCRRATLPFRPDGKLDKPFWHAALWSEDFVDIEGDVRPKPPLRTRLKMLWDDSHLYIGAELEEPHLWATYTERDSIVFHENDFEVFLDPDGDTRDYLEIEINALGTIFDLRLERTYREGGLAHHDWDCPGLLTAVWLDGTLNDPTDLDRGWTVELAIPMTAIAPWSLVAVPPAPGDVWRINFSRVQWDLDIVDGGYRKTPDRPEHNWVWSPQGEIDMHLPDRWGFVEFAP